MWFLLKGMDPSQTRDLNLGEVQTMAEGKAQPMRDTKGNSDIF